MSARTLTVGIITCDDSRCIRKIEADTARKARTDAAARGWAVHTRRVGRDGLLDYCPDHREPGGVTRG